MPFNGFQGLVNGWIKVNSKNVVVRNVTEESRDRRRFSTKGEADQSYSSSGAVDSESMAIKRFNNRRNTRKLERTISLSDLLREMALEKEIDQKFKTESEKSINRNSNDDEASQRDPNSSYGEIMSEPVASALPSKDPDEEDMSLQFVAGFFGGDISLLPPPQFHRDFEERTKLTAPDHRSLPETNANPAVSLQSSQNLSLIPGESMSSHSKAVVRRSDSMSSSKGEEQIQSKLETAPSLRSTPPLQTFRSDESRSKQHAQNPVQQFFKHFPHPAGKRCGSCEDYENRLMMMASDIDYLRSEALKNEGLLRTCDLEENSLQSKEAIQICSGTSARILQMEQSHRNQIEDITKQWAKWQLETQNKLVRFAMIAKDLNEQYNMRNQEVVQLEDEVFSVKAERDLLNTEISELRAAAEHYEIERRRSQQLQELVLVYERSGLDRANVVLTEKDALIRDLTNRLELAIQTIEIERHKQSQRRQIIFPQRSSLPYGRFEDDSMEELMKVKEQLRIMEIKYECKQQESTRSEAAYKARIDELEAKLASISY